MRAGWIFVVVLVALAAWKVLGPRPGPDPADAVSPAVACVRRSHEAMDLLADGTRDLTPDDFASPPFLPALERALAAARVACACPDRGCDKAREAIEVLERASRGLGIPEQAAQAVMSLPHHLEGATAILVEADLAARVPR